MEQSPTNLTADVLIDEEAEPDLSIWFGSLETACTELAHAAIAAASDRRDQLPV